MSDYKEIIRNPKTLNWFKTAMGMNITREGLLAIVQEITRACYADIRKVIQRKHGVSTYVVCNQCHTPNVLPCDLTNKTCNRQGLKCAFHEIHKPLNCRNNNLCNEICKQIVEQHRFRNKLKLQSFLGPTWIFTDASKWCTDPWQIAKCFLSKDGSKDVNNADDTDFNGIINVIINCEYFQRYFKDDLTQQVNVCTKCKQLSLLFQSITILQECCCTPL
ncbi:hypothetical protein DPMN_050838 [Dreissena polymorpha]|uniref:Uncharacterized protein n=1 Tax=Dreissena polymorpha TaxID=45954 RepID=A0A9D4CGV8_DREPO|nr:hypothetical protein DPMN_050838 [Dreissena polymorpha]